jgi:hypothetical protein
LRSTKLTSAQNSSVDKLHTYSTNGVSPVADDAANEISQFAVAQRVRAS